MRGPAIYLFAAIGIAASLAVPVTAQYFDNDEYGLFVREAFADYDLDLDELAFLEARAGDLADTALDVAKATVPYAANHVNLPNAKANLALGVAGKIIEKIPTSQQVASQKARQQMPSGSQQLRQGMQKDAQEQSAQKAANQAKMDSVNNAAKESASKMRNGASNSQQSSAHPVQDALKAKPAVPAKSSALSNLKFPKQSSNGGSGSSSGKSGLQRSNSMPVQSTKQPTPKLQRSNSAPAKPPVPSKPKALQGKKLKSRELLKRRIVEQLREGDLWWL